MDGRFLRDDDAPAPGAVSAKPKARPPPPRPPNTLLERTSCCGKNRLFWASLAPSSAITCNDIAGCSCFEPDDSSTPERRRYWEVMGGRELIPQQDLLRPLPDPVTTTPEDPQYNKIFDNLRWEGLNLCGEDGHAVISCVRTDELVDKGWDGGGLVSELCHNELEADVSELRGGCQSRVTTSSVPTMAFPRAYSPHRTSWTREAALERNRRTRNISGSRCGGRG